MKSDTNTGDDAARLQAIYDYYIEAAQKLAVLQAGLQLHVWDKIAAGYRTAQDIAHHEGWDPVGTRVLLDALHASDLLDKDEQGYRLAPLAEKYLLADKPSYAGHRFLGEIGGYVGRGQLAAGIRTGKRPFTEDYTNTDMAALWAGYYVARAAAPEPYLEEYDALWRALGIEPRDGLRMLDIACGWGGRTLALARRHPGVRVTLLDRPPLLELARQAAEKMGISQQVTTLPGDLQTVDYGQSQFDLIWFGSILWFFGPEDNVALLRKACNALLPGGTLVINQRIADDARRERKHALTEAAWFYSVSTKGDVYTFSEYRRFLGQAGFANAIEVNEQLIKANKA